MKYLGTVEMQLTLEGTQIARLTSTEELDEEGLLTVVLIFYTTGLPLGMLLVHKKENGSLAVEA